MRRDNDQRYRIRIKNWDQYQREMQGGEKRRRRREWVAISVDLFSDPDWLALDATHSRLWLGLLLHAGKVGPEFELSPSYARVLFDLRRTCDFQVLADQGFIDLEAATRQDKQDKQDRQDNTGPPPAASVVKITRFDSWWEGYPKKRKKKQAREIWRRKKLDRVADQLINDVAIRSQHDARWQRGYIPDPTTYLNGERWQDELEDRAGTKHTTNDDYFESLRRAVEAEKHGTTH